MLILFRFQQAMRFYMWLMAITLGCGTSLAADLHAVDFGIRADGKTDDGPAILKMVKAARTQKGGPVRLIFPAKRVVYAATGEDRYLFQLRKTRNITLDGGGSTFLLHPHIRMVDLEYSQSSVLRNFNVDYTPHPFIETVIQVVDPKRQYVDVRPLDPAEAKDLGGPTKQDGEQWFGGFVWCENGEHPKAARHYNVKGAELLSDGQARIFHSDGAFSSKIADNVKPGVTRLSVPRPGVAHRYGPGPLFKIHDTVDARLENITVWGAPWFTFSVYRNSGELHFVDVDVVPKPGANRMMAGCRDAFHVTGNRAKLVFDSCDTSGIGDDDYNFCVLSSSIRKVISPTKIVIRQKFPIQYNPMRVGETLMVMNDHSSVIGGAKIAGYDEKPLTSGDPIELGQRCPEVTITLETPINGLTKGLDVWSEEASNSDTTMKNCTATFSIRMQTSLKIDRCKFICYNVSYGMSLRHSNVEGPGPATMKITNSEFLTGRGSGYNAQCDGAGPFDKCRIQEVFIEGCTFRAPLNISKARSITLLNNQFYGDINVRQCETLKMSGNTREGQPFILTQKKK